MKGLGIRELSVEFGIRGGHLRAVRDVDFFVPAGETLGLVGESGSGKSTLARAICGLVKPSAGEVLLDGMPVDRRRSDIQMVFQDPYSSLNPRMTIGAMLKEALAVAERLGIAARSLAELLELVALSHAMAERYPHELSGGQRQRVAIARALAVEPRVLVLDEVTAALDVSVQASLLNMLKSVQQQFGFACVFISHDLAVVRHMSTRVAVMYLARIVEQAAAADLFARPQHPYTRTLLSAVAGRDAGKLVAIGEMADPRQPPAGCNFHPRCPEGPGVRAGRTICMSEDPTEGSSARRHRAACHFADPLECVIAKRA